MPWLAAVFDFVAAVLWLMPAAAPARAQVAASEIAAILFFLFIGLSLSGGPGGCFLADRLTRRGSGPAPRGPWHPSESSLSG